MQTKARRELSQEEEIFLDQIRESVGLSEHDVRVALKRARQSGLAARIALDYGPLERQVAGSKGNWFILILCLTVIALLLIGPILVNSLPSNVWLIVALCLPMILYGIYMFGYVQPVRQRTQEFNLHVAIRQMQETASSEYDDFKMFFDAEYAQFRRYLHSIESDLRMIPKVKTEDDISAVNEFRSETFRLRQTHAKLKSIVNDLENRLKELETLNHVVQRATELALSDLMLFRTDEVVNRADSVRGQAEATMKDVSTARKNLGEKIKNAASDLESLKGMMPQHLDVEANR